MSARKSRQLRRNRERSDLWRVRFNHEYVQYNRKARGWLWVFDPEDGVDFANHWYDDRTVLIHKGRKP